MRAWRYIGAELLYAIHERQLAEHGGCEGVRDAHALEAALARPRHMEVYGQPGAAELAAAYAYALVRSHGFVDGNKRTAWVVARLFLADNGFQLGFEAAQAICLMQALAAGSLTESQLAQWFAERLGH